MQSSAGTLADILVIDDDPGAIQIMGVILSGIAHIRFATNGRDALRLARIAAPDLILLDAEMPEMTGFEVCAALKADPALADVPVIFVTSHKDEGFEIAGFDTGAADFIAKPVNPPLVLARVHAQLRFKRMSDALRRSATVDALTGVANRRRFDEVLQQEWLRARRARDPIGLIMVDVDHFKLFNDHYGHPAGDACLRSVAEAVASAVKRPADLVARYGGEEFAVLLPHTSLSGADTVARLILSAVKALGLAHEHSPTATHVTVSAGAACCAEFSTSRLQPAAGLVAAADKALYAAKAAGRGRACSRDLAESSAADASVDQSPSYGDGLGVRAR